jgi:lipoprotein-anchoring transpeptidase ErfK/SrfK
VYPDGRSYDVADVPWVLPFMGDYTFHGAPWRHNWGTPLSNGCVSMPTAAAKRVYDWTPVGTQVTIHY